MDSIPAIIILIAIAVFVALAVATILMPLVVMRIDSRLAKSNKMLEIIARNTRK